MKEGYIVANISNCGNEFFGVYKNEKRAERQLRKIIRNRFGRCPRNLDKLYDVGQPNHISTDDSYCIINFGENDGEW